MVRPCQSQLATYTGACPPAASLDLAATEAPRLERAGRPPTCTGIHPYRFTIIYDHLCILALLTLLTLRFPENAHRSSPSANAVLHICHRRDCPGCCPD